MNFIKKHSSLITLLVLAVVNLVVFHYLFGFHENNDTDGFIYTIDFFRGHDAVFFPNRYMVPFYPVVSAKLLFFLSPVQSLIVMNIIFYFGLLLLTYGLIARVFKNKWIGFVSALFVATNYAMIRYGLTQVQDMGGYFWCVAAMYAIWRWREQKENKWLILSSIAVACGILTKETGGMGSLFAGIVILFESYGHASTDGVRHYFAKSKKAIKYLAMFAVAPLIVVIVNILRGREIGFSSLTYFIDVWKFWAPGNYTLLRWFGVNVSTYNLAWIAVLAGLVLLYKKRRLVDRDIFIYLIAVLPTSFTYLAWPVFISRTVFISAWLFLPLASYGLYNLYEKGKFYKQLSLFFVVLLMVTPYVLQNTLRYSHMFVIIDQCHKNPVCVWNSFWQNRDSVSKIK